MCFDEKLENAHALLYSFHLMINFKTTFISLLLAFFICIAVFVIANAPFAHWGHDEFSSLGTFLGGFFGPIAIFLAAMQYFQASEAQREANENFREERIRQDLKAAIERRSSQLTELLCEEFTLNTNGSNINLTLDRAFNTLTVFHLNFEQFDWNKFNEKIRNSEDNRDLEAMPILMVELLMRITKHLNYLKELAVNHDKHSGNNVESSELMHAYSYLIRHLKQLNYPLDDWFYSHGTSKTPEHSS